MINYKPFFNLLSKKKVTQYKLVTEHLISSATLQRMRNNKSVTLKTIEYLCNTLNCSISDIVSFK